MCCITVIACEEVRSVPGTLQLLAALRRRQRSSHLLPRGLFGPCCWLFVCMGQWNPYLPSMWTMVPHWWLRRPDYSDLFREMQSEDLRMDRACPGHLEPTSEPRLAQRHPLRGSRGLRTLVLTELDPRVREFFSRASCPSSQARRLKSRWPMPHGLSRCSMSLLGKPDHDSYIWQLWLLTEYFLEPGSSQELYM